MGNPLHLYLPRDCYYPTISMVSYRPSEKASVELEMMSIYCVYSESVFAELVLKPSDSRCPFLFSSHKIKRKIGGDVVNTVSELFEELLQLLEDGRADSFEAVRDHEVGQLVAVREPARRSCSIKFSPCSFQII